MGQKFGKMLTAQVLTGSRNKKVIEFGFDRLSTYGILRHYSAKEVANLMEFMISQDLLAVKQGSMPTIYVTAQSKEVLKGNQKVLRKGAIVTQQVSDNDPLFEELRVLRKRLAYESNVPPFVVFSDKTLKDMCAKRPKTDNEFLEVSGVGANKLDKYGEAFLEVINQ